MTNCIRTAIAALALAMSLSSVRAEPALSVEIGAPDAAGSGIAPKNIIFDDDYALYADGMAAHYLLLELERAGYAKVLAMVADSSNTYPAPAMASINKVVWQDRNPGRRLSWRRLVRKLELRLGAADRHPIWNGG